MQPSDLAFFTSYELIEELMRRKTFLGVVIHAEEDCKGDTWAEEKMFKVHFNSNLTVNEACGLLASVTGHIDRECS